MEIEYMLKDAEYYRGEDGKKKLTISDKNALPAYCYKMFCAVGDVKLKGRISESDKNTILDKCNKVICWMDANEAAEKEEFVYQQKQLESVCNSNMQKRY
jgi:L1 cell adhesion molecule like protein